MDEAGVRAMDKDVIEEVEDAYQSADEAPDPEPKQLYTDVYAGEERER
jgi:TPP-dependent pyruvate/acetoin dehydrogenase alpha subunit